ncbi:MAG: hypothetical protein PUF37_01090 [Prevotellaceae bacterium]|nr:hypothetical protein [Prevotellaceae bacterium]
MTDKLGNDIREGDCVIWYDPEQESRDLSRIWTIDKIDGDNEDSIIHISDDFGEAEVCRNEIERF